MAGCQSSTCTSGCEGCTSQCSYGCGGCDDDCWLTCFGGCDSKCSDNCTYACQYACKTYCNTACTAANQSTVINNLGANILKGNVQLASDINAVKQAIQNEFTRRGKTGYAPYSIVPASGNQVLTEHGRKILDDCYTMDKTKDWRNRITNNSEVTAANLTEPIEYIKTLMRAVVGKP